MILKLFLLISKKGGEEGREEEREKLTAALPEPHLSTPDALSPRFDLPYNAPLPQSNLYIVEPPKKAFEFQISHLRFYRAWGKGPILTTPSRCKALSRSRASCHQGSQPNLREELPPRRGAHPRGWAGSKTDIFGL